MTNFGDGNFGDGTFGGTSTTGTGFIQIALSPTVSAQSFGGVDSGAVALPLALFGVSVFVDIPYVDEPTHLSLEPVAGLAIEGQGAGGLTLDT